MSTTSYKRPRISLSERITRSVIHNDSGCWIWQLSKKGGYGRIGIHEPGRPMQLKQAHRVSYELFIGPIPEGKQLDHLCRNRACVNPEHLEPVTAAENNRRKPVQKGAPQLTQCFLGHPLSGDNLRISTGGFKRCKECDRRRWRDWYYRSKSEAAR